MTRTFSAMALSLTLALTSLSVTTLPARANDDVAKVLAGLAFLGIIAAVANDNKKEQTVTRHTRKKHPPAVTRHPVPVRKVAPRRCLRDQWTHRGVRQVYAARCMHQVSQSSPPRDCLRAARTNSGPRRFYTARCLRNNGWRT